MKTFNIIALVVIALALIALISTETKTIMQQIYVVVQYIAVVITAYVVVRLIKN